MSIWSDVLRTVCPCITRDIAMSKAHLVPASQISDIIVRDDGKESRTLQCAR